MSRTRSAWWVSSLLLAAACGNSGAGSAKGKVDVVDAGQDGGVDAAAADAGAARPQGAPPEVTANAKDWPLSGHDYASTRASFDSSIDEKTVSTLKKAWNLELPGSGLFGAATASPIVIGGTVYYIDMMSNVFALDLKTGKEHWRKEYELGTAGPNGLAVGWGKLFFAAGDHGFAALDLKTGHEVWTASIEVPKNGGIDLAPIAYDGLVYLSTVPVNASAGYAGEVNGTLYALDAETGAKVWEFKTVKSADLWGNTSVNSGGGAWYWPTLDTERGVMFWGIGNPAPYPGTTDFPAGASRPGDNLYTDSVLALGNRDGKLKWYFQEKRHDLFDHDFQNPPILISGKIAGKQRRAVIGSGKTGTVVALDADTGAFLWRTAVGTHQNDHLTTIPDAGVEVFPGDLGGVETPPAYAEGVIYVPVVNWGRTYYPGTEGDLADSSTGELVALNAGDGSVKWKTALPTANFGSALVVNDLVFTSSNDADTGAGLVFAFSRKDGKQVWRYETPMGINAPLAVAGDTLLIPAGNGTGTPNLIALKLQ